MAYLQHGRNALRQIIRDTNVQNQDRLMQPLLFACQGVRYRKLEVILTTSIEKLGKAGETVRVAPGYFRNHLMPKLLAVPNIDKFVHLIREQRKIYQPEEEEVQVVAKTVEDKTKEYEKAANRLVNARLVLRRFIDVEKFRARATKDDPVELRSPVTKDELVAEVARQLCVHIEPENLYLPTPLSTFGEFEVPLRLPKSIPLPEEEQYLLFELAKWDHRNQMSREYLSSMSDDAIYHHFKL
ncbi:Ribosomal protein L9/RNase H1 isoform 2 [Theobroma cacao]|uniref:Large ribosomal subunit protein bL9c n=1 Tax=Theobroma cacao TaxID=3641 RepID=A0A061FP81_THECC|nr:Ribosomal protein L9/RNase H1 isoform 2 [Theobroma cacao]EOY19120.1 Ribosomal protein L9/RNase H1 isoform 2 [Theobroma cacao]EOY19122.1 Ribosomal protein L9/RNase H1 isoform 2 [Theobroma cacao]